MTGTWNSSFTHQTEDDWHYVLDKLDQKKIQPEKLISHRFDLENAIQGMQDNEGENTGLYQGDDT